MSALGTEGKEFARSLLWVFLLFVWGFLFFFFILGVGHRGRKEGILQSVSNVLLSRLLKSVLKMLLLLKFSARLYF